MDKEKITRAEFIGAVGGLALAAVVLHFGGLTDIAKKVAGKGAKNPPDGQSYGASTYGGTRA